MLRLRAISLTQAGWLMTRLKPDWGEGRGQLLQADPQDCLWDRQDHTTALELRKFFISTTHSLFSGSQSLVPLFKYRCSKVSVRTQHLGQGVLKGRLSEGGPASLITPPGEITQSCSPQGPGDQPFLVGMPKSPRETYPCPGYPRGPDLEGAEDGRPQDPEPTAQIPRSSSGGQGEGTVGPSTSAA